MHQLDELRLHQQNTQNSYEDIDSLNAKTLDTDLIREQVRAKTFQNFLHCPINFVPLKPFVHLRLPLILINLLKSGTLKDRSWKELSKEPIPSL